MASATWAAVAAPQGDLPAALAGGDRPDQILAAVHDLETFVAAFGAWLRDRQLQLLEAGPVTQAGDPAAATPPSELWTRGLHQDLLKEHPALALVNARLPAIEGEAERLRALTSEQGRVPLPDYRRFLDQALEMQGTLLHLLGDAWNRLANIDPLTGLGNRAAMLRKLSIECERNSRNRQACCVAILDLDHFKTVNDRFGHHAGDTVLRSIASLLAASVRPYDEVFRYGGDEFVLCLPNADLRTAWAVVERLRLRAASWSVPIKHADALKVTLSIGVAPLSPAPGVTASLELADAALYAAKARGRNALVVRSS